MGTQQMILYTVAALIVMVVFLILFRVQAEARESAIDATRYRAAKQDMLNFTAVMEQDFRNIGAYLYWNGTRLVGDVVDPALAIQPGAYDSNTTATPTQYWFEFLAQTDTASTPVTVRYEWEATGETVQLNDGTVRDLIRIDRYVAGALSGFTNTVTDFNLRMLPDTSGGYVYLTNLHEMRLLHVGLKGISTLGKGEQVEETRYNVSYRPIPLIIKDNS